jgi:hypothetical protein
MGLKSCFKICAVIAVSFLACSAWAESMATSKFISGNPQYEADKDIPGAIIYRKPGVDISMYTKVLIDPIEIWISEDTDYKGLDPDEAKSITDTLRQALKDELEPDYPVVNEPGPGVLGIRIAITNVGMKKKKRGLLGYTPVGLVLTTAGDLAGLRMELASAVIEAEALDGESHEQLAALIDPFRQDEEEDVSWENVRKHLSFYAKRLRTRLLEGAKTGGN